MGSLDGKGCVVTGAASGNGRAMALRFAEEGGDVVVADLQAQGMEDTAKAVRELGRRALVHHTDVSKLSDVEALFAATAAEFGGVDVAVANAGVSDGGVGCLDMTEEQWQRTLGVNLTGVFFTLQVAARRMLEGGRPGRLIAIASIMAEWGNAGAPAYCASKAGVKSLVKSFAQALGRHGITCNGIGPGFIHTAMTAPIREAPELEARLVDATPVGRIGSPEDIAHLAAYLASDGAGFVSGTTIFPDGGITAGGLYSTRAALLREAAE